MDKATWIIIGATSAISEEFARIAAFNGHPILLVGRNKDELAKRVADMSIRSAVTCRSLVQDLAVDCQALIEIIRNNAEVNLFIAACDIVDNKSLDTPTIARCITTNCVHITQIINAYWHKKQPKHQLIFLSSVAACRGRGANSFYGGNKALVETFLQGLQQLAHQNQNITIARLGFIDTVQTYGKSSIFYAASPKSCAKACWQASSKKKRLFYFPFFWHYIMELIQILPFCLFKRIKN